MLGVTFGSGPLGLLRAVSVRSRFSLMQPGGEPCDCYLCCDPVYMTHSQVLLCVSIYLNCIHVMYSISILFPSYITTKINGSSEQRNK